MSTSTDPIPQPKPWPIVGNLPEMQNPQLIVHLAELAKEYGPIFRLEVPGTGSY